MGNQLVVAGVHRQEVGLGQPPAQGVVALGDHQGLLARQAQLHRNGHQAPCAAAVQQQARRVLEHLQRLTGACQHVAKRLAGRLMP